MGKHGKTWKKPLVLFDYQRLSRFAFQNNKY